MWVSTTCMGSFWYFKQMYRLHVPVEPGFSGCQSQTMRKQCAGYGGQLPPDYFNFYPTQILYLRDGGSMFLCTVRINLDWKGVRAPEKVTISMITAMTPENSNLQTFYGSLQPEYTHHKSCSRWLWGGVRDLQTVRIIKRIIQDNCVGYPGEHHQKTWHEPPVSLPTHQQFLITEIFYRFLPNSVLTTSRLKALGITDEQTHLQ